MQYLTTSRMLLAKELLVERQKSISLVVAVGYGAEAAFKREFGVPPCPLARPAGGGVKP